MEISLKPAVQVRGPLLTPVGEKYLRKILRLGVYPSDSLILPVRSAVFSVLLTRR